MATDQHDTVTAALPVAGAGPQMRMVAIGTIVASLTNPRKTFDQDKLQELADSIKASGVHQPILLRPLPAARVEETSRAMRDAAGKAAWPFPKTKHKAVPIEYELVAGERRWRASQMADVAEIPAMIRELTDDQALEIQIIENLQRENVTALEESEGYRALMERGGKTAKEVAEKIGKSLRYVYQRLQLLDLIPEAAEAVRTGAIDPTRAREIACIRDPKLQKKALDYAATQDWNGALSHTTREVAQWVRTNIMLRMDRARFDIASDKLCPEAGACTTCPKHTGANPDLFSEGGPDLCTDPSCYRSKEAAHDQAAVEKAKKSGHKVITAEEARGLINSEHIANPRFKGYTLLDDTDYSIGVYSGTVRKALGKDCPDATIIIHPTTGKSVAAVKTSAARRILEDQKHTKATKDEAKTAQTQAALPVEERREYRTRWQDALTDTVAAKITATRPTTIPPELLRALLLMFMGQWDEGPFGQALGLPPEFDISEAEQRLLTLSDEETPAVFMRWVLFDGMDGPVSDRALQEAMPRHRVAILADAMGVDVAQVKAATKTAMEGEDRAKAMEAQAQNELPPLPSAAQATVSRAKGKKIAPPAALARDTARGKTTKAQATAEIAAALGALEGKDQAPAAQSDEAPAVPDGQPAASAAPGAADKAAPRLKNQAPAAQGDDALPVASAQAAASAAQGATDNGAVRTAAWPFPNHPPKATAATSAVVPNGDASAGASTGAAAKPIEHALGDVVRVKEGLTSPGGKLRKICGRVCLVESRNEGQHAVRWGPRRDEIAVGLAGADLEPYRADPIIGSKVRVLRNRRIGNMERSAFEWRQGTVKACTDDGWQIMFTGKNGATAEVGCFESDELEVLE